MRRVKDTVPQAIQLCMVQRLLGRIKEAVLAMGTDHQVASLLQEDEDVSSQRYILQERVKRLQKAATELRFH